MYEAVNASSSEILTVYVVVIRKLHFFTPIVSLLISAVSKRCPEMDLGIMTELFKIVFGNTEVMIILLGFSIIVTFFLVILQVYNSTKW
ncbi:hypothetical protein KHA80_06460 [Anaerobacillus sp. HL2]|nr:hypothetical protein KHA80_06460 [Anaerobacillus sp. HL2]